MSRKSRKEKAAQEIPEAPPPEPEPPQEIPAVVPEEPPQPAPEPELPQPQAAPEEVREPEQPASTPVADNELPPPPSDVAEQMKKYPPIKTRKPGIASALKRAGVIFGKDIGTMAKHGLVSSVILLAFLLVIFYISSYAMFMLVTTSMEGDGDGDGGDGPKLTNDGSLDAIAGADVTVNAGTVVTLDSSATVHRANIMYVQWSIRGDSGQIPEDTSLYGQQVTYLFNAVGTYEVNLMVVDEEFHGDEDNMTVIVTLNGGDSVPPLIPAPPGPLDPIMYGTTLTLNSNATDNVGIVNYTWIIRDVIDAYRYEANLTYDFQSTGGHDITLIVKDAAGNFASQQINIQVNPTGPDNQWPYAEISELPQSVTIGESIQLDASNSNDDQGIADFIWYIKLNDTTFVQHGQQTSMPAQSFGMYEIKLVVRDGSGNVGTDEKGVICLAAGMDMPSQATWTSTPFQQDVPFNVMTFVYGAALLSCVIFIGGLFSKGFAYEIQKGTAKTLFFAPVSVTNMLFAKMLYPLVMGPLFIFPLVLISTLPLKQELGDVFKITLVSYLMTALVLASAAYGSCLLYALTKRMTMKPTALARMFMYLSVLATLTVFMGLAFLMDQWFTTDMWTGMYSDLGSGIAMFSPFHQGGILISNMLLGTTQSLDWVVFAIPAVLIAAGAAVSTRLFPDLFSRE